MPASRPQEGTGPSKVTLYRNGSVYTAADPFATAMLVDGDTVAWVGSEQAAASIADSSMEIIDLRGALVAPGFVDSHAHLTETGIALDSLQLRGVRSARELLDAVAASGGDGAVLGHGWDESRWDDPTLPGCRRSWSGLPRAVRSTFPVLTCTRPWSRRHS
jgi:predicted amidohydrolase YtcJ